LDLKAKNLFRALLAASAICVFIWGAPLASRFFSSFDSSEGSNAGRLEIWRQSIYLSRQSLFTGAGLGNYPLALNPYENYRSAVTSHNLYLDILVEIGVFGLIAWLLFMFYCFKNSLKLMRSKEAVFAAIGAGCFGFFVYFSVHSFFETAIFNPTILAILMIAAGLAAAKIKAPLL
jgi:O-antigen ligase